MSTPTPTPPPSPSAASTLAFPLVACSLTAYYLGSYALFYRQRHCDYIRKRNPTVVFVETITVTVLSWLYLRNSLPAITNAYQGPPIIHFYFDIFMDYIFIPTYLMTFHIRMVGILNDYYANYAILHLSRVHNESADQGRKLTIMERILFYHFQRRRVLHKRAKQRVVAAELDKSTATGLSGNTTSPLANDFAGIMFGNRTIVRALSINAAVWVAILLCLLGIGQLFSIPHDYNNIGGWEWGPLWVYVFGYQVLLPFLIWELRKVDDSYNICRDIFLVYACLYIGNITYLAYMVSPGFQALMQYQGAAVFLLAEAFLCHTIMVLWPAIMCPIHERRNLQKLKGMSLEQFAKAIQRRDVWMQFKSSLAKDFSLENGYFIETLITLRSSPLYRSQLKSATAASSATKSQQALFAAQPIDINAIFSADSSHCLASGLLEDIPTTEADMAVRIKELWNEFLAPGSPHEINIPHTTRATIEKAVRSGRCTLEVFSPVLTEVVLSMYNNNYARFLQRIENKEA
ncbi:hypothetical protein RI367_007918 [Sorochytrium milnesiophthora]